MANKYTKQKVDMKRAVKLYESGMTQSEVAAELKTTQKVIWARFKQIKYKCRIAAKREQFGENNDSWKGDKAQYAALHYRVYKIKGCPRKCEVCGTTDKSKKYEWASLSGRYDNPDDYKRMCQSCHAKYDNMAKNFRKRGDAL